ncbi:MAG: 3-phosphoshikimate 1-carboxyvinyltransferase [Candidatus Diapherotrites archaeon]
MKEIKPVRKLDAVFQAPPSKAYTLRALFIASLAKGKSVLKNALNAEDQQYAAKALNAFGAKIEFDGKDFLVEGTGGNLKAPSETVFVENSGVTARFLIPLAALAEGDSVIDGNERMRQRPLQDLIDSLELVGVEAKATNDCPPVNVKGKSFHGGITNILGDKSSQYLSAMLISGAYTKKGLLVQVEGPLKSKPYVDITIECMKDFGIKVVNRNYKEFYVRENQVFEGREYEIEGDFSSSSYFFAAAAVTGGKVRVENLKSESKQGDKFFLEVLEEMGCKVTYGDNFVEVQGSKLKGVSVDMADYPDIVPTLGIVAAFADGKTTINNIEHLALKESNRIETTAKNLMQCGVPAVAREDSLEIVGKKPKGTEIETFNDHRIAMAFTIMGLAVEGIKIKNPEVVNKSFPNFYNEFEKIIGV